MQVSQLFPGATAVTKALTGDYFLAVNNCISLINKNGIERELIKLDNRILDLIFIENVIYGVGDNGCFIRSLDYGVTWLVSSLSTRGSIWSICAQKDGTIVTHGNNVLFLSNDYGQSWKTICPFQSLNGNQPSIRSILLDDHFVYVGTKVHTKNGGIWRVDLKRYEVIRIKEDTRMIACILKYKQYLVSATGTCRGFQGTIEYCHTSKLREQTDWEVCESKYKEQCYLHLSQSDGYVYATTSQDKNGVGKVSRVYLDEKLIIPCAYVHGHGWRVSNHQSDFFVAGFYGSLFSNSEINQPIYQ